MKVDTINLSEFNAVQTPVNVTYSQNVDGIKKDDVEYVSKEEVIEEKSSKLENRTDEVNKENTVNMEEVAQKLQDFIDSLNTSLEFSVDQESGRDIIKVIDKESGNLIRQFPSEEVLDVIKSLSSATGMLFDEKV